MKRPLALALAALATSLAWPSAAQEKFALGLFHFNLQYVAGGMLGFWAIPNADLDLENDAIEDMIVTESFAPVIDLYEKHPSWGVDIELQGYFLDALAARHPKVLEKLRTLAKSGQIDVVSFHYSDQLFVGYPAESWKRSQALTQATFDKYDVPLSRTVFCQEGQAGEAIASRMSELGYRNMVWPKNLWTYQHGDQPAQPLYGFGDVLAVQGGKGASSPDVELTWTFLDDGELLATGDLNPYFPDVFRHKPEAVKKYEDELLALEAQGFAIVTVDKYVDAVKDKVPHAPMPPLLDGTWQPKSTNGVLRWLGGKGIWPGERDNEVRSLGALAQRELLAAETAAKSVKLDARAELDAAWRLLSLGQVTDASGINPFRGEVEYGIAHCTEALRVARDVIRRAKAEAGEGLVTIDPAAGSMSPGAAAELRGTTTDAPLELDIDAGDREVVTGWEQVEAGHHRVEITFGAGTSTKVRVSFPGTLEDEFVTTRALADDALATYRRSDFSFESFQLALPIGLVSLAKQRFLIKDQARVHLAAKVTRESGDIEIVDETLAAEEGATWVFHLFEGTAEQALALARSINVTRRVSR
ncbi:MAG: hypothetical protein IT377_27265 [Polyangiaceae bacterium]|nr:hypothetical protein [Polyangiaceae bacterium]